VSLCVLSFVSYSSHWQSQTNQLVSLSLVSFSLVSLSCVSLFVCDVSLYFLSLFSRLFISRLCVSRLRVSYLMSLVLVTDSLRRTDSSLCLSSLYLLSLVSLSLISRLFVSVQLFSRLFVSCLVSSDFKMCLAGSANSRRFDFEKIHRELALPSRILFASAWAELMHRPRSDFLLHFNVQNTYQIRLVVSCFFVFCLFVLCQTRCLRLVFLSHVSSTRLSSLCLLSRVFWFKLCLVANSDFIRSRHCPAAFSLQVPNSCTYLGSTLIVNRDSLLGIFHNPSDLGLRTLFAQNYILLSFTRRVWLSSTKRVLMFRTLTKFVKKFDLFLNQNSGWARSTRFFFETSGWARSTRLFSQHLILSTNFELTGSFFSRK